MSFAQHSLLFLILLLVPLSRPPLLFLLVTKLLVLSSSARKERAKQLLLDWNPTDYLKNQPCFKGLYRIYILSPLTQATNTVIALDYFLDFLE